MCSNHQNNRHFYKCPLCLCVAAVDSEHAQAITCGYCQNPMEYMGRVAGERLAKDEIRCACDFRCIDAVGPKCDCSCGGKNHGSGKVVVVTVDAGKLVAETKPTAKQVLEAREYRATLEAALAEWRPLNAAKHQGFIPRDQFCRWLALERAITAAKKMRSHAGRMKALAAVGHRPTRQALPTPAASSEALAPVKAAKAGCLF